MPQIRSVFWMSSQTLGGTLHWQVPHPDAASQTWCAKAWLIVPLDFQEGCLVGHAGFPKGR